MKKCIHICVAILILSCLGFTYPIDGYDYTGIARLYRLQKMQDEGVKNRRIRPGAYLKMEDIKLRLLSRKNDSMSQLLTEDPELQQMIKRLLPGRGYSATVMDITDPENLRYAAYRENVGYQPGSVGKIVVLTALMNQLAKLCPDSWDDRNEYLKGIRVSSRYWGTGDHHTIPVYDIEKDTYEKRRVRASDVFSLYEWIDHMVSVSNNGAASVVFREAMLMAAFEEEYFNLTEERAEEYFKETRRDTLTNLMHRVANEPLRELGITKDEWRLGGMFTRPAGRYVGRKGGSIGTPKGLMKYMVKLEQGQIIDERTSLEMKRMLYLTDRRIRYAYSKKLDSAAVYFKSGSFYKCDRTKNPNCGKYAGNVFNYMNSVIIVEHPDGPKYLVCLMTNVLNKNSAGAHMYLASKIDNVIQELHPEAVKKVTDDEDENQYEDYDDGEDDGEEGGGQ